MLVGEVTEVCDAIVSQVTLRTRSRKTRSWCDWCDHSAAQFRQRLAVALPFRPSHSYDLLIRFRIHTPSALHTITDPKHGRVWDLRSAFLVGDNGRPIRGSIESQGDSICCNASGDVPLGISLLVDVPSAGRIVLQTCFLPQRAQPYDLFLEIARWLIKQFVEECETWQMWNPALSGPAFEYWESARETFRSAMRCDDPLDAERLALQSIASGIQAGECMTLRHADHLLGHRHRRKAASSTTLGVTVDPRTPPTAANTAAAKQFDVIALATPWKVIEPNAGKYDFTGLDAWVKWAASERKALVMGPLIDFTTSDGQPTELPAHALAARKDTKKMKELVWAQVQAVVSRYHNSTPLFVAVSGANCAGWSDDSAGDGLERMVEFTRTAVVAVRDVKKTARVVVEIQSPGAESWRGAKGTSWPTSFLQRLVAENLSLAAAGVRFCQGGSNDPMRELMTIGSLLDGYIGRELSIFITGFGIPSASSAAELERRGSWHGAASPQTQAEWGSAFMRVALARSFVEGAWWSRLQDVAAGPSDGVVDAAGKVKPVLAELLAVRQSMMQPTGAGKSGSGKASGKASGKGSGA